MIPNRFPSRSGARAICGVAAFVLSIATTSHAGLLDSPTPVFGGKPSLHLWSVSGVMTAGGLGTVFSCTNPTSSAMTMSVELFVDSGGDPCNDASAVAVSVPSGGTAVFITQNSSDSSFFSAIPLTVTPLYLAGGSARVVSSGKGAMCSVMVVDVYNSPPLSMSPLTVIARGKQRGG